LTTEELLEKMTKVLPGNRAHKSFSPLRNFKMDTSEFKKAAVALHLKIQHKKLHLILIKRTAYNGAHSQQIAFPGGKFEQKDKDLEYTARRESFEEIGIPTDTGLFIGKLSEVLIPVSSFRVTPFVFLHKTYPNLIKEQREVQEILICELKELDTFKLKTFENVEARKGLLLNNVPGLHFNEHFIWGATALILHEFNTLLKR
jgi:8-oxo-dGTP pyrophosphatase MutT (NUDIX family)